MARIRSIHPGLFTDEAFVQLSCDAQMLLIGLWTEADDQGVFEWKPLTLRMRLRPTKDGAIDPLLEEMTALNIIRQYEVAGRKLGAVRNFRKWQKPKTPNAIHLINDEIRIYVGLKADGPEIHPGKQDQFPPNGEINTAKAPPFPPNGEKSLLMEEGGGRREDGGDSKTLSANAENENTEPPFAESLSSQDLPNTQSLRCPPKERIAAWAGMELFDQFWRVYPKQRAGNREKAMAAYQRAVKRGFSEADILAGAHAYAASREVAERFAKGAAAWLNDDRFTHDYSETANGRKNYPNTASKQDRIEDALAAAKLEIAERWAESTGADAAGGTFDGRLYDDEHFRQDSGIIDGDYTVVSG